MGHRLRQGAAAALALGTLMAAIVAAAANAAGQRAELKMGLTTRAPGSPTGFDVHVLYRHPDDPDRKPPALTKAAFELPPGTRFDGGAVPRCNASDDELRARGRDACPASSTVGRGTFTAMTGFPGADPVETDVTAFNGGDQIIELVTFKGTNTTAGFDRLTIEGNTLVAHPPATPGGPPDGRTVPRDIRISFGRHGDFVAAPPVCPGTGLWTSRGIFGFADGGQATVTSTSPCQPGRVTPRRLRCALRVAPRRVRAGRRVRLRFRTRPARAVVRLGHRRVRTNRRGKSSLRVRFRRPGRRQVTLVKRGCPRARARLVVLPAR